MDVKEFLVEGAVRLKDGWRKFRIRKRGVREEDVKELVYSELGGRFKVKRRLVRIEGVQVVEDEAIGREGG
ncbi:MAG: 50S ribosomal protein L18Ae [Candidatus Nezhaarchaeota archaeon]|nr:50S ribosomal protein L18Ae [Candidatus Nezhaarchaeota archaeon]